MRPRAPLSAAQRTRHKENLLLASQLARGQAVVAFDELAARADVVAERVARWQAWLASPLGLAVAGVAGVLVVRAAPRRVRWLRLLRWGGLAWGVWRRFGPLLVRHRGA